MKPNFDEAPFAELSESEAAAIGGGSRATCTAAGAGLVGGILTGQFEISLFCGWYIANYC